MFLPMRKYEQSRSFANINEYYSYLYKNCRYLNNFTKNINKKVHTSYTIDDILDIPIDTLNKKQYHIDLKRRDLLTYIRFSKRIKKIKTINVNINIDIDEYDGLYININDDYSLDDAYKELIKEDYKEFIIRVPTNLISEILPLGTIWIEPWSDDNTLLIHCVEFELVHYDKIVIKLMKQYHNFQRWALIRDNGDRCNDCALEANILAMNKKNILEAEPIHLHFVIENGRFHTPIC